jgi:hypothetical protein
MTNIFANSDTMQRLDFVHNSEKSFGKSLFCRSVMARVDEVLKQSGVRIHTLVASPEYERIFLALRTP